MATPVHQLLHPAVLPPEIDTAIGKHNQAFITLGQREGQRNAATAGEDHRQVNQQWEIHRLGFADILVRYGLTRFAAKRH